jgi:hypothetical protein
MGLISDLGDEPLFTSAAGNLTAEIPMYRGLRGKVFALKRQ